MYKHFLKISNCHGSSKKSFFKRQTAFPLTFHSTSVSDLVAKKHHIMNAIYDHGCVCIKNVDFNQEQMVEFTQKVWNEVVILPEIFCFKNQDKKFKQIARVGNIQLDGTIKDSRQEAIWWHQDGDFWGEDKKHIFNCLHTREQPVEGGQTQILDLVQATQFLKTQKPEIYERMKKMVGLLNLEEIDDFKIYNEKNTTSFDTITKHKLIKNNGRKGEDVLFLSVTSLADPQSLQESDLRIADLFGLLEREMGYYAHKWQKGDMLIWDNLQVMHRSSGKFEGRRLLFRTQGRD